MTEVITKLMSDMDIDTDEDMINLSIKFNSIHMDETCLDPDEVAEIEQEQVDIENEILALEALKQEQLDAEIEATNTAELEFIEDQSYKIAMNELADEHYEYSDDEDDDDIMFIKQNLLKIKKELDKHRKFSAIFCVGLTKKGIRCSRKKCANKKYCKTHQPKV